ncbi:MAG: acetyl/propionyl/methylcrotonyl-CoA carboxylase subunit alpha [Burkholderiales bacterium]|nr:acetyl/propionyl/methylcrotonyl-CoA carboxylase subunit alpha [Burkholderiales bacterium]
MFNKILIANRGEIACRVIRTCKRMGIRTVAVYSDADQHAQHVKQADEAFRIGGPRPVDSYLKADVILDVAKRAGAQAVHPGYGFLSENEDFARQCELAGIAFIGPTPEAIEKMGSKSAAKALMEKAGVPVVPGYHGDNQDVAFLAEESQRVGYPQLIKAVAGGGGKGMRLVEKAEDFTAQLEAARREAKNAFGNDDVLIERYVLSPHHIEFQVFGDTHGNYVHLFERECSIQRRHQKVLEETPSPFIDSIEDELREKMGEAAVAAARAIAYRGAGTIEFIVGEDRQFFFMEMNTRLQVEHPITEMITGEDLVEWQVRVAAGEPLPLKQTEIITGGHAIEVRICAENPANDFLPETGKMHVFATPTIVADDDVRLDTGVVSGDEISVYYDPMIAKLITWGEDRAEATRRMQDAIAQTDVLGVKTNLAFLQQLVKHPAFLAGKTDTSFIPTHRASLFADESHLPDRALIAASLDLLSREASTNGNDAWDRKIGWWLNRGAHRALEFHTVNDEEIVTVDIETIGTTRHVRIAEREYVVAASTQNGSVVSFTANGHAESALVLAYGNNISILFADTRHTLRLGDPFLFEGESDANAGRLTAMMPGRVVKVMAKVGDSVKKGQALIIMEAMKMEHTIISPKDGIVERVAFKENDLVPADAVLFAFAE